MPLVLLLAMIQDDSLLTAARARTSAEQRCVIAPDSTAITGCGLRRADRYRVPFVVHDAGDPAHEPVPLERQRLLARTDNCEELSTFLVGCGAFGRAHRC